MKSLSIFLMPLLLLGFSFEYMNGQEIPVPTNYYMIQNAQGDLDNDNIDELAVSYNIGIENEFDAVDRILIIYKLIDHKWKLWIKSEHALLNSKGGGMMGNPLGELSIENGKLSIYHEGGSSWKWSYTDTYQWINNEFYLVEYQSFYGKLCEYFENVEFNLLTGEIIFKKEFETCESEEQIIIKNENETFFEKVLKITLEHRNEKEILIVTPLFRNEIYISSGTD